MAIRARWHDGSEQVWDTATHVEGDNQRRFFVFAETAQIAVIPDYDLKFVDQISTQVEAT